MNRAKVRYKYNGFRVITDKLGNKIKIIRAIAMPVGRTWLSKGNVPGRIRRQINRTNVHL